MTRSADARWRVHRDEGRVATGLRSRASGVRQALHGLIGIACWVIFALLWVNLFLYNLPDTWPVIALAILALFVLLIVLNMMWVRWNRFIYWRHDRRRVNAVLQETRFDRDVLGRPVVAPARESLIGNSAVGISLADDGSKLYTIEGVSSVPVTGPAATMPVVATPAPFPAAMLPGAAVMIDRTPPSAPHVSGGSAQTRPLGRVEVTASGSVDTASGLAGYQWRASLDGGHSWSEPAPGAIVAVEREGDTLVQFRALDNAGNASEWSPAPGADAGRVRLRAIAPPLPVVSGGSAAWQSATQVLVGAQADAHAGAFTIEHRIATGGAPWSAPQAGAQVAVGEEGETLVQFRSRDGAGNVSAWAPAEGDAAGMVRLDRIAPSAPLIEGDLGSWAREGGASVRAHGSRDDHSGIAGYEYRFSLDGGASWSVPAPGAEVRVEAEGLTIVQFRAIDGAGNPSAWSPEVLS